MIWRGLMWIWLVVYAAYGSRIDERTRKYGDLFSLHRVVFPFVFVDDKLIGGPNTKWSGIRDEDKEKASRVICDFVSIMFLSQTVGREFKELEDKWGIKLDSEEISDWIEDIEMDIDTMYRSEEVTLSRLMVEASRRLFVSNKESISPMTKLGRFIIEGVNKKSKALQNKDEKDEKAIEALENIKRYGAQICNVDLQRWLVEVQEIICDISLGMFEEKEKMISLIVSVYSNKMNGMKDMGYFQPSTIDARPLVFGYKKYGREVAVELVVQAFLGKSVKGMNKEYIEEVARVIDKRKRRKEEEEKRIKKKREELDREKEARERMPELLRRAEEAAKDLLREEKLEAQKRENKARKRREKKPPRPCKAGEEVGADEERLEDKVEMEENVINIDVTKSVVENSYKCKIHKRVMRWRKDAGEVRRMLKESGEEEWRWGSDEIVMKQKETHDIVEVIRLFKSSVRNKFFDNLDGGKSYRAIAKLWKRGGKKDGETGFVEIGVGKDKKGEHVVYHLMFRRQEIDEDVKDAMEGEYKRMRMVDESEECLSEDASGFEYAPNTTCEVIWREDTFEVIWGNPKNVAEVWRKLIIFRKLQEIEG